MSILPFSEFLFNSIVYLQFFIFIIFYTLKFDFVKFFEMTFAGFNFAEALIYILFLSFTFSVAYNYSSLKVSAVFKLFSYVILIYIFSYIFVKCMFADKNIFENFLSAILVFTLLNTMVSIIFFFSGFSANSLYPLHSLGLFNHPNTLSLLYTISIPVLFYKFFARKINAVNFYICLFLFLISLLFTFSRAGYLGVAVSILFITFYRSKKLFFAAMVIVIIVAVTFVLDVAGSKTDSSLSRLLLAATAVDMILKDNVSFLWGYGVYNSLEIFREEKVFFGNFESVLDPHNLILLLGIQFGMVVTGLVVFIVLFFPVVLSFKKKYFMSEDFLIISLCNTIIFSLFIHNMLEDVLFYPEFWIMPIFLVFLGIDLRYYFQLRAGRKKLPVLKGA